MVWWWSGVKLVHCELDVVFICNRVPLFIPVCHTSSKDIECIWNCPHFALPVYALNEYAMSKSKQIFQVSTSMTVRTRTDVSSPDKAYPDDIAPTCLLC